MVLTDAMYVKVGSDHLVARANAQTVQCEVERSGPVAHAKRVPCTSRLADRALKALDVDAD